MTAGELAVALVGSCKNLAGKLKSTESERAALLQSVDMHRSENRRLLEVPSLPRYHTFIQLTKLFSRPFSRAGVDFAERHAAGGAGRGHGSDRARYVSAQQVAAAGA